MPRIDTHRRYSIFQFGVDGHSANGAAAALVPGEGVASAHSISATNKSRRLDARSSPLARPSSSKCLTMTLNNDRVGRSNGPSVTLPLTAVWPSRSLEMTSLDWGGSFIMIPSFHRNSPIRPAARPCSTAPSVARLPRHGRRPLGRCRTQLPQPHLSVVQVSLFCRSSSLPRRQRTRVRVRALQRVAGRREYRSWVMYALAWNLSLR